MEKPEIRILTLTNIKDEPGLTSRVTLSPVNISLVEAFDDVLHGQPVKRTNVYFLDGGQVGITLGELDLFQLEQAVGAYTIF